MTVFLSFFLFIMTAILLKISEWFQQQRLSFNLQFYFFLLYFVYFAVLCQPFFFSKISLWNSK